MYRNGQTILHVAFQPAMFVEHWDQLPNELVRGVASVEVRPYLCVRPYLSCRVRYTSSSFVLPGARRTRSPPRSAGNLSPWQQVQRMKENNGTFLMRTNKDDTAFCSTRKSHEGESLVLELKQLADRLHMELNEMEDSVLHQDVPKSTSDEDDGGVEYIGSALPGSSTAHKDPNAFALLCEGTRSCRKLTMTIELALEHDSNSIDFFKALDKLEHREMMRRVRVRYEGDAGIDGGGLRRQAFDKAATALLKEAFDSTPIAGAVVFKRDSTVKQGERAAKMCVLALLNGPLPMRCFVMPLFLLSQAANKEQMHWWNCDKCFAELKSLMPQHIAKKLRQFRQVEAGACGLSRDDWQRMSAAFSASDWENVLLPCPACGNIDVEKHNDEGTLTLPCKCQWMHDFHADELPQEACSPPNMPKGLTRSAL